MNKKMLAGFASLTLIAVLLPAMPAQAQPSAYFQAMTNLNPAGYWPMHEVEAPAQGDIETNYGTLGLLGTGYYPDWMGAPGFIRQEPGALAPGDSDPAVCFTGSSSPGSSVYTNALYVPLTSPLSTLNPPFSVECWFFPSNKVANDIWSQNGYEGLNAGASSGGGGNYHGIRLSWSSSPAGPVLYTYDAPLVSGNQTPIGAKSVPTNQWCHVVITCDANTNFSMYTNGVLAQTASAVGKYAPDYWTPFEVGNGRGNTRPLVAATVDEVAVYTNVLSTSDILAHYQAGTNSSPATNYFQLVTNDNPVIYLRMDSSPYTAPATWPVLTNYGSVVGNGFYTPGTMPGIVPGPFSPNGMPFGGLSVASGTNVAQFSGVSSFADVGSSSVFNPTGQVPFVVTAMFRGNPCDGRTQTIVGHGSSWSIYMNTSGKLVSSFGTNSSGSVTSSNVYNDGNWHQVVAAYLPDQDFGAGAYGTNALFVDGVVAGGTVVQNNFGLGTNLDAMIGADPQYTNNPAGVGREFAGQVCEVAIFTNVLTLAQVQALYNVSGVAPYITTQPLSGSANQGAGFMNTVVAGGSALAYQWYTNGVALPNQTNASLILNPVLPSYASTNYYVVMTNSWGSVTSAVVSLTVFSSPTIVSQLPAAYTNVMTLFAGASPTFSISAIGAQPLHYFWVTNGVVVAGAANTNYYTFTNVQAISPTNFYCIVTNIAGAATSIVQTVSVISDPTNLYPAAVLVDHPIGYWRLNEGPDDNNGDQGVICNDYMGGNNGLYTNVNIAETPGYNVATDPETCTLFGEEGPLFNSDAGQIAGIGFSSPSNTTVCFSVEAWVNGYSSGQISGGLVNKGYGGGGQQFDLDLNNGNEFRFFVVDASTNQWGPTSTIHTDNNWHHLVGVCDESNGVVSLYVDGVLAGSSSIPTNAGILTSTNLMTIGSRMSVANTNDNLQFYGYMNDVAVYNYALSASQVAEHYVAAGIPPTFIQMPPPTVTVEGGGTLVLPATAMGTTPLDYTWYDVNGGTNVTVGSTNAIPLNATLTVANVPAGWNNDTLRLTVTNLYGSASATVKLVVFTNAPQITMDLPPQVSVLSGDSYTYSIGSDGQLPMGYQWYNVTTPVDGQTNSTYTVTAGSPGSTTYYVVITNIYGSVTSSVSTFTSIASLTNAYSTNILQFNPVGYWPMHEVEAPAPGDIETNYGTLGLLGTGYYPDWLGAPSFIRQEPGALTGDNDPAVYFIGSASGTGTTNALYVPHTSPLSTLNPPFSVECWLFPGSIGGNMDIWSQNGYEGLNAGASGAGTGNTAGIRLSWSASPAGFVIYTYDGGGNQTLSPQTAVPTNQWCHVVVTCDASTNISLVINGSVISTRPGVGLYSPDYWTPFEVGNGRGNTRALSSTVDEVAVYTNVLSTNDILAHYNDGISGGAGVYYSAVTNDNPVIYLRMDSFPYTAPAAWPALINYGSAVGNGVYSPGTMPGIVPGPANSNGVPFTGMLGTNVAQFSGVSSFADVGNSSVFNPIGAVPFTVTAMFRGNPADNRYQTIVGHSDDSWCIAMNTNGTLQCTLGTNSSGVANSVGVYNDGKWHQVFAVYTPASVPTVTGTNAIYVDGVLDTSIHTVSTNGIGPGTNLDVMIGADPQYTNNPAGIGRQFAGQVCEVAIFNSALTAAQIQQIYNSAAPVTPVADVGVSKSGPASVYAGSNFDYTISVTNLGPSTASAVVATDSLPANVTFVSASGGGTLVGGTNVLWTLGDLAADAGTTLTLTVTAPLDGSVTNVALVGSSTTDTNMANNTSAAVVTTTINTTPTNIVFSVTGNQLTLSWPSNQIGWQLQAQTNSLSVGISTNWVNIGFSATDQVIIPINVTNGSVFYRLVLP